MQDITDEDKIMLVLKYPCIRDIYYHPVQRTVYVVVDSISRQDEVKLIDSIDALFANKVMIDIVDSEKEGCIPYTLERRRHGVVCRNYSRTHGLFLSK